MFKNQSFENNIYMKIFRWAYIFLMLNLAFWIVNIPLFLADAGLAIDARNAWAFALALLPLGAGLISVMSVLDTFIAEKDVEPMKSFFQGLKKFGAKGLAYWGITWLICVISLSDIYFIQSAVPKFLPWSLPFFVILMGASISVCLYACYLQVRNPVLLKKDILKASLFIAVRKWYVSLVNIVLLGVMLVLMVIKPQFGFVITPSLLAALIYLNCQKSGLSVFPQKEAADD